MLLNIFLFFQDVTAAGGTCFGCLFIWSLLPFLIGLLTGFFTWNRYKQLAEDRESQIIKLKRKITEDEKARIALQQKVESANSISTKLKNSLADCSAEKAALARQLAEASRVPEPEEQVAIVEEAPETEEVVVKEEVVIEEPEPTVVETIAPVVAAAPLAAVGAVAAEPQDKEDDYLPCKAYEGHKVNDTANNIAFFKHDNGQYYFVLYAEDGSVRLRSEGFRTARERDQELSGVVRLRDQADQYKRVSKGKYFMDVLYDETGREVGRSCLQKVKEEPVVQEVAPVVETKTVEPAVVKEPEVVERQVVRVKRTVNISGLEDLDGIDIGSQTKLINMGLGSMTALAAADEASLRNSFAGTSHNWRYWWMQSRYATAGDWANYYSLRDSKGENLAIPKVEEVGTPVKVVKEEPSIRKAVKVTEQPIRTFKASTSSSYGAYFANNDLQIIEGVGPKIQQILMDAGYTTWESVANSSYDDLKRMLSNAGPRYRIHDPRSWARQAQLAATGKWEDLVAYQKFLNQSSVGSESYSKVEKLMNRHLGFSNANASDLKIVEGIGPKIEGLLKAAGIQNWDDLSRASTDKLKLILQNAGSRYRLANPTTWPTQAGMAVRKEWTKLKEYQDMLQGGKDVS